MEILNTLKNKGVCVVDNIFSEEEVELLREGVWNIYRVIFLILTKKETWKNFELFNPICSIILHSTSLGIY